MVQIDLDGAKDVCDPKKKWSQLLKTTCEINAGHLFLNV